MDQYKEAMARALFLANKAREMGDVPVGAVVIDSLGRIGIAAKPCMIPVATPK